MPRIHAIVLSLAAAFVLTEGAAAQTAPQPWPHACPVPATLANDGSTDITYSPCTPHVVDSQGNIIRFGLCLGIDLIMPPGGSFTSFWDQRDEIGIPVSPGVYTVNGVEFDIGAANCALMPLGAPYRGATRSIELCAPFLGGQVYVLVASTSTITGIDLGCGNVFPLDFDALMLRSLSDPATFPAWIGTLDHLGCTSAPALAVPDLPSLSGVSFHLGFITLDPLAPCGVGSMCGPVTTTII